MTSKATISFVATLLVVASFGVVPVAGTGVDGASSALTAPHGSQTNFTVTVNDHTPGKEGTTMTALAANLQADLAVWGNLTVVFPAEQGASCKTTAARAAGVDTNNDDPGTHTDKTFVGKYSEQVNGTNEAGQNFTNYDFYEEGSFAGESISLRSDDQIVARLADCWTNPSTPGWYRWWGYINGTTPNDEYDETNAYSHWYYICDCESYDAAVNKIGPAPTEAAGSESDDGSPGTVSTKTYRLQEDRSNYDGSGGGSTPTPTPAGESTATPTTTATPSGGGTPTATATATPTATATATPTATATATAEQTATATATAEQTATEPSTPSGQDGGSSGSGPGFGIFAGVLALLAAALLAHRRD